MNDDWRIWAHKNSLSGELRSDRENKGAHSSRASNPLNALRLSQRLRYKHSLLSLPPPPPSLPPRHWFTIVLFVWSDKKRIHIRHPYTIIMYRFFIFHIVTLFGVVELDNNKHQFTTMKKLVILPYFCTYDTNLNLTGLTSDRHRQLTEFD